MQEQLNNLQTQINDLKKQVSNKDMPIELRETIRNEVIKEEKDETQATTVTTIVALGNQVTVPTPFTKVIVIKWKGKEYKVPYYV